MAGSHLYAQVNCPQNLKYGDFTSVVSQSTAKICAKMRASRAARLFFLFLTNGTILSWRYRCRSRSRLLGNLRSTTATVDENVTSKYNLALS